MATMDLRLILTIVPLLFAAPACTDPGSSEDDSSGETGSTSTSTGETGSASMSADEDGSSSMTVDSTGTDSGNPEPPSLESCMEQTAISLDCDESSRFQYVAFGDVLGCSGSRSATQEELVRFTFSLDEVIDTVPQIRSIRVVNSDIAGDTRFEASAPTPVSLPEVPSEITEWAGDLVSDPPGLFGVAGAEASVSLDAVPDFDQLSNMEMVSGTFEIVGGSVTTVGSPVEEPNVQVFGCFMAPGELHAVETD